MDPPHEVVLELARARNATDPFQFDLEPQDYLVRAAGGAYRTITIPWDDAWLDELTRVHTASEVAQRVGDRLRTMLEPAGFAEHARTVVGATLEAPVVLTIRAAAAELFALPWELVTLGGSGRHLAETAGCVVRYAWPGAADVPPTIDDAAPRVVFAWSAAGGAVPAAEHLRVIAEACAQAGVTFDRERDVLADVTPQRLAAALADPVRPASVLHILCHGDAMRQGLVWGAADGRALVDGSALRAVLADHAGHLRLVVLCACSSADPGPFGNHLGSVAQALHRAGLAGVVASRYPLSVAGANILVRGLYPALLVERASLERALLQVRAALRSEPERDWLALQWYGRDEGGDTRPVTLRPYRGLLPFERAHGGLFFGRDEEIATLVARIEQSACSPGAGLQVVLGTSGSGKSSLVRGGLIPRLLAGPRPWRVAVLRPGERGDPIGALLAALAAALAVPATADSVDELLGHLGDEQRLLVVVDQFEELFHQIDPVVARRFGGLLWRLSDDVRVVVVVTMRVDTLDRSGELHLGDSGVRFDAIVYDERTRILLRPPGAASLRAIIELPAHAVGLAFENGLVDRLLADADNQPGALPLLEHVLDELWRRRDGRVLTFAGYAAIGGLGGALAHNADAVIDGLDADEQRLARRVLTALIQLDEEHKPRGRRQVLLGELRPDEAGASARFDQVVTRLVTSRLVVEASGTLDLAHEALMRGWPRLRTWLDEDRDLLREAARLRGWYQEWLALADRPDDQRAFLHTNNRLAEIQRIAAIHPELVQGPLRGFIADGEWLANAQTQRTKRHRNSLSIGLGLAGCMYALAVDQGLDAVGPTLIAVVALFTAWVWELALSERVSFDPLLDTLTNLVIHFAALGIAFAGVHGELAAGDPRLTWVFVALSLVRTWTIVALVRQVPTARPWALVGLGPLVGFALLLVGGLIAPSSPIVWWAAAVAGEHVVTTTAYLLRRAASPPILSEGHFVAGLRSMQETPVVLSSLIVLIAAARVDVVHPLALVLMCAALVVFAAVGHNVRNEVVFSHLDLRRVVWQNANLVVLGATMLFAVVGHRIVAAGAVVDPGLRWGWAAALGLLLVGVIACGLAIERERRSTDQRFELLFAGLLLPVTAAVTALTQAASVSTWAVVQIVLLNAFLMPHFRQHWLRASLKVRGRGAQMPPR